MKNIILLAAAVFGLSAIAPAQNKSVYTSTNTKTCKTLESSTKEAGYYRGRCPGVGGYKLDLIEGDIRQTLNVISPANKTSKLEFWAFFGSFSRIGEKVEWRTKEGTPVALISRFYVADPEGVKKESEYLMVAKIGKKSCVTDIVSASSTMNAEARRLADAASGKPCKPFD